MKNLQFKLLSSAAALLAIACAPMAAQSTSGQESKNQQLVMNWYHDVVVMGHVSEASKFMADDYVEHDPRISGGRAGFIQHYENASARPADAKQIGTIAQGDYVLIVWQRADKDPKTSTPYTYASYDVVRVKNGKIKSIGTTPRKIHNGDTPATLAAPPA